MNILFPSVWKWIRRKHVEWCWHVYVSDARSSIYLSATMALLDATQNKALINQPSSPPNLILCFVFLLHPHNPPHSPPKKQNKIQIWPKSERVLQPHTARPCLPNRATGRCPDRRSRYQGRHCWDGKRKRRRWWRIVTWTLLCRSQRKVSKRGAFFVNKIYIYI